MTTHKAIREALPAIPAELLHLCETEREAVRRYALQVVQSIDPARFTHGHNGDSITIYMDGQPVHWVPVEALTQALATTEPTSASPADMQVYDKIAAGYWTERKGEPVGEVLWEKRFGCAAGQLFEPLPIGTKLYTSPQVPEGFALVPVEPTEDMIVAFAEEWYSHRQTIDDPQIAEAYAAMLDAARKGE